MYNKCTDIVAFILNLGEGRDAKAWEYPFQHDPPKWVPIPRYPGSKQQKTYGDYVRESKF